MLPGLAPTVAAATKTAELTWVAATTDTSNLATYTFSGQSFGDANPTRHIIVGGTARFSSAATISSITIGGVSATVVAQATESTNLLRTFIAIAAVPTGTSGDIVVTMSGGCQACRIGVWRAVYLGSATPSDTLTANNVNDPSGSIDVPANGFIVGAATNTNSSTGSFTGLTTRAGAFVESDHYDIQGDTSSLTATTVAITAVFDSSNTRGILVAAAFV